MFKMAREQNSLLILDADKLFETHSLQDIEKIHDLFELEIEKKRVELRSMVGDRYRDVLAASDAIKWMQNISHQTVCNIQGIINQNEALITNSALSSTASQHAIVPPDVVEERTIVIQIRLFLVLNEEIFSSLKSDEMFKAVQIYLLTQHVYTGLRLIRKNILESIPFLRKIKGTLDMLRAEILRNIHSKLRRIDLDTEETCSNLNALLLLENRSIPDLLRTFSNFRIDALNSVINNKSSHTSVRLKITEIIKSLIASAHMIHDCFLHNLEDCRLSIEMKKIASESAPSTLSLINLPNSPLTIYIPEITKKSRPKCTNVDKLTKDECNVVTGKWLQNTREMINFGIRDSLNLVNNIKGLHIIREEATNIDIPENWQTICAVNGFPSMGNIWIYLFQDLVTQRVQTLISKKISEITDNLQKNVLKFISEEKTAGGQRTSIWKEELNDFGIAENQHRGLYMKTKGFSPNLVEVCEILDQQYLSLLEEITLYLYGEKYSTNFSFPAFSSKDSKVDREPTEKHLKSECKIKTLDFVTKIEMQINSETNNERKVSKSLRLARILYGFTELCPNFKICCNCNQTNANWLEICAEFSSKSLTFWSICVRDSCKQVEELCADRLSNFDTTNTLKLLLKWDTIEIQEQTTDNNIYNSQIRVPMKPSYILQEILTHLSNYLNVLIPCTFPKKIHQEFIEANVIVVFSQYEKFMEQDFNQTKALQLLFDVKFLTTFCVASENLKLIRKSQDICDVLRKNIDPFDLDVFYKYLQSNVKQSVLQSQVILGCLLPVSSQLASIGILEKNKEQDKNPSILAVSTPSTATWFPLLPITSPLQKKTQMPVAQSKDSEPLTRSFSDALSSTSKRAVDAGASVRSGAAALFGAMTNDWFS